MKSMEKQQIFKIKRAECNKNIHSALKLYKLNKLLNTLKKEPIDSLYIFKGSLYLNFIKLANIIIFIIFIIHYYPFKGNVVLKSN